MSWADSQLRLNAAMFDKYGEPISYVPDAGGGDPISTSCILLKERVLQSASPGFFSDVQVDPLVVTRPQRNDQVQWADGTIYVVAQVLAPPYDLTTLALHRKFDP